MKYWLQFFDNNSQLILSLSTISFMGEDLNFKNLKDRINKHFIKGTARAVELSFLGKDVNKSFIAGFRNGVVVFIDTNTKKEYSVKEFSSELNILEEVLTPKYQQVLSAKCPKCGSSDFTDYYCNNCDAYFGPKEEPEEVCYE